MPPIRYKEYGHNGLAGCVQQRRAQTTGGRVGVYHAELAGMDPDAGPWATVCEEHGGIVNHPTLALARYHAADPAGWCEACQAEASGDPLPEWARSVEEPVSRITSTG